MLTTVLLGYALPGLAIAAGFLLVFVKIKTRRRLQLLNYPLVLDLTAMALAWAMHGGSLVGGMSVVVAGMAVAGLTSFGRYAVGYIDGKTYHPGHLIQYKPESLA